MTSNSTIRRAVRLALASSAAATAMYGAAAVAQQAPPQDAAADVGMIVVTGTRVTSPGVTSSSPIYSVSAAELQLQQQPEVERILRLLPITKGDDGQNANNGTEGAATIDLRGLGAERTLVLIDGKRMTPYNFDGLVDTSTIPTAMIERIDIVTGGASAVYGSDATAGVVNIIMKRDFEGFALTSDHAQTEESDAKTTTASAILGANVADGRGNVVLSVNWTDREGVLFGARPLGQLGIETATGAGYAEFLAGQPPPAPPAGCGGPGSVAAGGSSTTVPTRTAIAGGPGLGQFREDGTLAANCGVFNFNPFNYYQTPQERFGGTVSGRFEMNEHAEAYARFAYSSTEIVAQVAPSGIFGSSFFTPLANPFISDQARAFMISAAEAGRTAIDPVTLLPAPTVNATNWTDVNGNGVVDAPDDLNLVYRRRTVELGERATTYDNNAFQFVLGFRGDIVNDWSYDLSYQRGESDRTETSQGYTNIANFGNAINSVDGVTCRTGGAACVPINVFGGFGTITPEMAAYSSATGIEQQNYDQQIVQGTVSGAVDPFQIPWASSPLAVSFGAEYREESAVTVPDECLKLAPTSCLGGAGGFILPIEGSFNVQEVFGEAILPIVNDRTGIESLDLEMGYRHADYNITGTNETWKYGLSWRPVDTLLIRAMKQKAARAPNVGELFAPNVTGLENASRDPCSIVNAGNISPALQALCISTGMTAAQVGTVEDIVAGQINSFEGTDPILPTPEEADTLTIGFVWTPDFGDTVRNAIIAVDYYDIDIANVISEFTAQEVLDGCYVSGLASECTKVRRVFGTLTADGSGVELLTTNLDYLRAEGIEVSGAFGVEIGRYGSLNFSAHVNKYLTQESQSAFFTPVIDCVGFYGVSCEGPLPEIRWVQRTTWDIGDFQFGYLWRHLDSTEIERVQYTPPNEVFPAFRQIDSFDYIDLQASWHINESVSVSFLATNVFDEDPPVVGNEAADTTSNSGNTFPGAYDPLGRVFTFGVDVQF